VSAFGLPTLGALDAQAPARIWLCTGKTDMRCGFDRLAAIAEEITGEDPTGGHLFVFRNRRGDRLKILAWDAGGYVLFYKRLEAGVFRVPRLDPEQRCVTLRASELAMLLDGIDLSSVKRSRRYRRKNSKTAG